MTEPVFLPHPLPRHMSHSQFKTLADCGEAYRLERVYRVPSAPNLAAVAGKAFHSATEYVDLWDCGPNFFWQSLDTPQHGAIRSENQQGSGTDQTGPPRPEGQMVDNELAARVEAAARAGATDGVDATPTTEVQNLWALCLERAIQDEIAGLTAGGTREHPYADPATWRVFGKATKAWPEKENLDWWQAHGPIFVQRWINWKVSSGWTIAILDGTTPAIEVNCGGMLGSTPVEGYIDVVMIDPDGQPVPVDKKTNSRIPTDPQQLGLYSVMLEIMGFPKPAWGVYWWARSGDIGVKHDLTSFTHEGLAWQFAGTKAMRDAGFLKANTQSITCSFCSVKSYCRAQNGSESWRIPPAWEMGKLSIRQ